MIARVLREAGITGVDQTTISRLLAYFSQLHHWNQRINLTGHKGMEEMVLWHLGDTACLSTVVPRGTKTVLDIGTGAGVPGLVLKILRPDLEVVLTDAARKKVSFLRTAIFRLGLDGVWAEQGRVGEAGFPSRRPGGGFDLVTSRALGGLEEILELGLPLLSPGGRIVAMKGPRGREELEGVRDLLHARDLQAEIHEARLPIVGRLRTLIVFKGPRRPS